MAWYALGAAPILHARVERICWKKSNVCGRPCERAPPMAPRTVPQTSPTSAAPPPTCPIPPALPLRFSFLRFLLYFPCLLVVLCVSFPYLFLSFSFCFPWRFLVFSFRFLYLFFVSSLCRHHQKTIKRQPKDYQKSTKTPSK